MCKGFSHFRFSVSILHTTLSALSPVSEPKHRQSHRESSETKRERSLVAADGEVPADLKFMESVMDYLKRHEQLSLSKSRENLSAGFYCFLDCSHTDHMALTPIIKSSTVLVSSISTQPVLTGYVPQPAI